MSGSLGRAPSVIADIDANLAPYDKKMKAARKQAEDLISLIERKSLSLDLDVSAALRDVQKLGISINDLTGKHTSATVDVDTANANQEVAAFAQALAALDEETTTASVLADIDQAESDLRKVQSELDQLTDSPETVRVKADVAQARTELSGLKVVMNELNTIAAGFTLGMAIQSGSRAILDFAKDSFRAASDLVENINKVNVVFGENAEIIRSWAADATENLGVSESAALAAAGTFGNLFVAMEIAPDAATEMSTAIVQLAADLGSFNNISTDAALEKLRAGLVGEVEPLRTLGVNLSAAAVQAKAFELGLARTTDELTPAAKAQAAYALIVEQTTTAHGDFKRNADEAANSLKTLQGNIDDLKATIGEGLTPAVADFSTELSENVRELIVWIERVKAADSAAADFLDRLGVGGGGSTIADGFSTGLGKARDGAESLFYTIMPGAAVLNNVEVAADRAGTALRWFGVGGDEAEASLGNFLDFARDIADTINGIEDTSIFRLVFQEIQKHMAETGTEYERFTTRQAIADREGTRAAIEYTQTLGRQAEAAGRANERNADYFLGVQLGSGDAARLAFELDNLKSSQDALADAYQIGLQIQSDYTAQGSEYASQQNIIEEGNKVLKEQLDAGQISQEEYNREIERSEYALARLAGGQDDATLTARDYAIQNGELMRIQDTISEQYPDLVKGSAEYNEKIAEAAREAGISQEAIDNMQGSNSNLAGVIADELIPALQDLINKILELDGKTADVTVRTNYTSTGSTGVGLTEFARGGIVDEPTFALIGEAGPELVLPLTNRERMKELLNRAGILALGDGGGRMPSGRVSGGSVELDLDVNVNTQPISWAWLFAGLDREAENYTEQASKRISDFVTKLDASDLANRGLGLSQSIAEAEVLRDALLELGDTAGAAAITAEINRLRSELDVVNALLETDAVQAWNATADAADAATRSAEAYVRAFESLSDANALGRLQQDARDAGLALQVAYASGADPAVIAALRADFDAANQALALYERSFRVAVAEGLFTRDELMALAQEGGDTLQTVLEGGMLTDAQIAQLIASGDEGIRAILDAWFGPDVVAEIEDGFNDISDAAFAQLLGMRPDEITEQWVDLVADGLTAGRLTVEQAMALLLDPDGLIPEDQQISLLETYESLGDDLARALASGDGIAEAQAAYDRFMEFLIAFAEANGLVVADILAAWDRVRDLANQPAPTPSRGELAEIGDGGRSRLAGPNERLVIDPTRRHIGGGQYLIPSGMLDAAGRGGIADPIDDLGNRLITSWTQQTDRMIAAMHESWAATSAYVNTVSMASSTPMAAPSAAPATTVHSPVTVRNEIGGREVDRYIIDVVTGSVRREIV